MGVGGRGSGMCGGNFMWQGVGPCGKNLVVTWIIVKIFTFLSANVY